MNKILIKFQIIIVNVIFFFCQTLLSGELLSNASATKAIMTSQAADKRPFNCNIQRQASTQHNIFVNIAANYRSIWLAEAGNSMDGN